MVRKGVMHFEQYSRQLLREYGNEVAQILQEVVPDAADIAVKMIRRDSKKRTGAYAKDWAKKQEKTWRLGSTWVVYNKKHYRLTHLLEKDHPFKNASGEVIADWKGDGVIAFAEEYTDAWIESELVKRLGDG